MSAAPAVLGGLDSTKSKFIGSSPAGGGGEAGGKASSGAGGGVAKGALRCRPRHRRPRMDRPKAATATAMGPPMLPRSPAANDVIGIRGRAAARRGGRKSIAVFCGPLPPSRPGSATAPAKRASRDRDDDGSSAAACPSARPGSGTAPPSWLHGGFRPPRLLGCRLRAGPGKGTIGLLTGLAASPFGRWTVKGFLHFGHLMLRPEGGRASRPAHTLRSSSDRRSSRGVDLRVLEALLEREVGAVGVSRLLRAAALGEAACRTRRAICAASRSFRPASSASWCRSSGSYCSCISM